MFDFKPPCPYFIIFIMVSCPPPELSRFQGKLDSASIC